MKFLTILLLSVFTLFGSETVFASQKQKAELESISKHAIKFGTGRESDVYIFVDPLCKYSRKIIKKIESNKMLQLTNSYYIMLYRLPRLESEKIMHYIYESDTPKQTLIDIMVDEDIVELENFKAKESTLKALKEITEVAKTLDMTKRPYMISFDKDSKYCRVSEGAASCLEELE